MNVLEAIDRALAEIPAPLDPLLLRDLAVELGFEATPQERKTLASLQKVSEGVAAAVLFYTPEKADSEWRASLESVASSVLAGKFSGLRTRAEWRAEYLQAQEALKGMGATHARKVIEACVPVLERFAGQIEQLCDSLKSKALARRVTLDSRDVDAIKWQARHLRRRASGATAHWSLAPKRLLGDIIEI